MMMGKGWKVHLRVDTDGGDCVEVIGNGEFFEYRITTARYAECLSDYQYRQPWVALMEGLNKYNSAFT